MAYSLKRIADRMKIPESQRGESVRDNVLVDASIVDEPGFVGVCRFVLPYVLHERPEHYNYTTRIHKPKLGDPHVMATGKTYIVNDTCVAVQILQAMDGHPCLKWTGRDSLEFVKNPTPA